MSVFGGRSGKVSSCARLEIVLNNILNQSTITNSAQITSIRNFIIYNLFIYSSHAFLTAESGKNLPSTVFNAIIFIQINAKSLAPPRGQGNQFSQIWNQGLIINDIIPISLSPWTWPATYMIYMICCLNHNQCSGSDLIVVERDFIQGQAIAKMNGSMDSLWIKGFDFKTWYIYSHFRSISGGTSGEKFLARTLRAVSLLIT